jgi:hypothetical protein
MTTTIRPASSEAKLVERVEKYRATVDEETNEIERLKDEGAYKFGSNNPRGREIKKRIAQAESRRATARQRLRLAEQALARKRAPSDREMLKRLEEFLTYEQGVTPGMTPAKHRDALAEQIGNAWQMVRDHLEATS